jgi:hypothetical protein
VADKDTADEGGAIGAADETDEPRVALPVEAEVAMAADRVRIKCRLILCRTKDTREFWRNSLALMCVTFGVFILGDVQIQWGNRYG